MAVDVCGTGLSWSDRVIFRRTTSGGRRNRTRARRFRFWIRRSKDTRSAGLLFRASAMARS